MKHQQRTAASFPAPKLFDYETVTNNLTVKDAIESVEAAFAALANNKVDVPMPIVSSFPGASIPKNFWNT